MKALTIIHPWAFLIQKGEKQIETRSWRTKRIGLFGIHAGVTVNASVLDEPEFRRVLSAPGSPYQITRDNWTSRPGSLQQRAIVAVAYLAECVPTEEQVQEWERSQTNSIPTAAEEQERAFGDYGPKRWAWRLQDVFELPQAVSCGGSLQLWKVPPEPAARVMDQLPPQITREAWGWL
jgi:hypothetical protein